MKIDELEQIIKILKQNDVNEFEFDNDGIRIKLTRGTQYGSPQIQQGHHSTSGYAVDIQPAISVGQNGFPQPEPSAAKPNVEDTSHLFKVESPIVGTFYRKPAPDAETFVSEGSIVQKGDTLCIIEAMKLMNEIDAPISGRIEKVMSTDGQVVEFGEVLFLINPKA